jgi:hypothetical protein
VDRIQLCCAEPCSLHGGHAVLAVCYAQIRTRLQRLEQQEAKLCLPDITHKLQQQHEQLQTKLQQFTTTLTDSKQANACLRARVDAAAAETKTQLQAATVGPSACMP